MSFLVSWLLGRYVGNTTIGLDLFAEEMDFETVPKISHNYYSITLKRYCAFSFAIGILKPKFSFLRKIFRDGIY